MEKETLEQRYARLNQRLNEVPKNSAESLRLKRAMGKIKRKQKRFRQKQSIEQKRRVADEDDSR